MGRGGGGPGAALWGDVGQGGRRGVVVCGWGAMGGEGVGCCGRGEGGSAEGCCGAGMGVRIWGTKEKEWG